MEQVVEFWKTAHREKQRKWLTGGGAAAVVKHLGVGRLVAPAKGIMEIGVGTGLCVRELASKGCRMIAVDICEEALADLQSVAECYLVTDELPVNVVDLAISRHLVQHMDTDTLRHHLTYVHAALRPGGIYALETPWVIGGLINNLENYTQKEVCFGGCCRTPNGIRALADECGGITTGPMATRVAKNGVVLGAMHIRKEFA